MKAVVLAYHNIGCMGIDALLRHGFEICAVFTHKDDPAENIWFDSVTELAASRNIRAPMFRYGLGNSISLATVTPSFVMFGAP